MNYLFGFCGIAFGFSLLFVLLWIFSVALTEYSQYNANPECKKYLWKALEYELYLAYFTFLLSIVLMIYILNLHGISESMTKVQEFWLLKIGLLCQLFFSRFLAHFLCTWFGKKFPNLHECKLLQYL